MWLLNFVADCTFIRIDLRCICISIVIYHAIDKALCWYLVVNIPKCIFTHAQTRVVGNNSWALSLCRKQNAIWIVIVIENCFGLLIDQVRSGKQWCGLISKLSF